MYFLNVCGTGDPLLLNVLEHILRFFLKKINYLVTILKMYMTFPIMECNMKVKNAFLSHQ